MRPLHDGSGTDGKVQLATWAAVVTHRAEFVDRPYHAARRAGGFTVPELLLHVLTGCIWGRKLPAEFIGADRRLAHDPILVTGVSRDKYIVPIFFVHTSLVLMWSLERKPHILDFYIRRIFRIYPLAIASILVLVVLHIPTMQNINGDTYFQMPGLKVFTANILLIQNVLGGSNVIGVLWTLPLEIQMYFLLPFLFFYPAELRGLASPTPMTVTVVYARSAFPVDSNSFVVCIPYFLSGVIAYVLFGKVRPRLPALLMPPLVLLMLCGFMFRPSWRNGWWLTLLLGITIPDRKSTRLN